MLGLALFAGLTWVIAATAQHAAVVAARPETADLFTYSLGGHVAGMTLLGCMAVFVASALLQRQRRWMAILVLAATATGPMTLIAAPVRGRLVAPTSMDTVWWWHVTVAAAAFAILLAWTVAVRSPVPFLNVTTRGRAVPSDDVIFVLVTVAAFAGCWNFNWHMQESPGALPSLGWAVLAAGSVVVSARGHRRVAMLLLPLAGLTLGVLAWAYLRAGGWPGVAGWEFNGMESPVVLSARVAAVTVAGPLLGLTLSGIRYLLSRRDVATTTRHTTVAA